MVGKTMDSEQWWYAGAQHDAVTLEQELARSGVLAVKTGSWKRGAGVWDEPRCQSGKHEELGVQGWTHSVGFRRRACTGVARTNLDRGYCCRILFPSSSRSGRQRKTTHLILLRLYSKHFNAFPISSGSTSNSSAPHAAHHGLVLLTSLVSALSVYPSGPTQPAEDSGHSEDQALLLSSVDTLSVEHTPSLLAILPSFRPPMGHHFP